MPETSLQLRAHAKINLALAVGPLTIGGNCAGMHHIASWMHAIDLHDEILLTRLKPGSSTSIDVRWADGSPVGWPTESDLVTKAHKALEEVAGPLPVDIRIKKYIPAGGGLGGGSSDAAVAIKGLAHLFGLGIDPVRRQRIAHDLGSDIPFFLDEGVGIDDPPRAALVTGPGDRIERLPPRRWGNERVLMLVCPPFGCPTGQVYRNFDDQLGRPSLRGAEVDRLARSREFSTHALFNDLAGPAGRVQPSLIKIIQTLEESLGVPVHVSGSGSTLFCFVKPEQAEEVQRCAPDSIVLRVRPTYVPIPE